jgi:hypothetical protein
MTGESWWIDADGLARLMGRPPGELPLNFTEAAQLADGRPYQHESDGTTRILVDRSWLEELNRPMSALELRQALKSILEAGLIGRTHPEAKADRYQRPLIFALGTIAGLASVALDGETIPPDRVELDEGAFHRLSAGEPVVLTTRLGYRVELRRVHDEGGDHGL